MRTLVRWAVAGCFVIAVGSCYPGRFADSVRYDTVTTLFRSTTDFGALQTYDLVDTVIHIVAPGEPDNVPRTYDALIRSLVRQNLNARGYVEEANPTVNPPDFIVAIAARVGENTYIYGGCYGGWWGYYPPYWPGYGWCWPYAGSYTFEVGTLLIAFVTGPDAHATAQTVQPSWLAGVNGLLQGAGVQQQITEDINQAFTQSPYLRSNP